jgi:hypothetical protein
MGMGKDRLAKKDPRFLSMIKGNQIERKTRTDKGRCKKNKDR